MSESLPTALHGGYQLAFGCGALFAAAWSWPFFMLLGPPWQAVFNARRETLSRAFAAAPLPEHVARWADRLVFDYNCFGEHHAAESTVALPVGASSLGVRFARSGRGATATLVGTDGTKTMTLVPLARAATK